MESPGFFGEWLKQRRKALDLTQEELALRAGCSVHALRKIETGERKPSKQLAALLARSLDVQPEDQQTFIQAARGDINLERLPPPSPGTASFSHKPQKPGVYNLPLPVTPLIGRDAELAALEKIFQNPHCRLLTLTGMGGIGKTRLAVEFASTQLSLFGGGIYFVSLAPLSSPEVIPTAIADVFGLTFSGPTPPKDQLLSFLASRTHQACLLVLDNLEHLLSPDSGAGSQSDATRLVMEIIKRVPSLKVLATSRERLNLQGEWTYELHGLPVPPADFRGELEDCGAVTFFILSARRAQADFEVRPDEQPALIRICQVLEGVPLAIELAAAWVRLLSCQEIAQEIAANLDFLSTSMSDVPERQRSVRASFDHSWKLLSGEERRVLRQLAVFHGGFSRPAAERIAGASLPVLASLHAKSLVRRSESDRYDLHEVIRQYALNLLASDPENGNICDSHSQYYLTLVREREMILKSASQSDAIRELTTELDNIRAAWGWAINRGQLGLVGGSLRGFSWLCDLAGWFDEGIEQMELVVQALRKEAADQEIHKLLGHALAQQGLIFFRKGRFDRAHALWEESLAILRPIGDPAFLTDPLVLYGILTHLMGDIPQAQALVQEGLANARACGDRWFEAYAIFNQGYLTSLTGNYPEGYEQMLAGIAIWRSFGDRSAIALGLNYISPTAIKLGYLAEAEKYLRESLLLSTQVGERWGMGTAQRNLGLVALARGHLDEAQAMFRKSLETFGEYIVGWDIARSLTYLGDAQMQVGDLTGARQSYLDGLYSAVEARSNPLALDALNGLARLHLQAGQVEEALGIVYQVSVHPAATLETKEIAGQIILEAEGQCDARRIQAIKEKNPSQPFELFVDRYLSHRQNLLI